jgi:hypothetical protein
MTRLATPLAQLISYVIGFSGVSFSLVTGPSFVSDVGRCLGGRGSSGTNIYSVGIIIMCWSRAASGR